MNTFHEVALVKDQPRRSALVSEDHASMVIAQRVLNGWGVGHQFVPCRRGGTVALVWFTNPKGHVWSMFFESRPW